MVHQPGLFYLTGDACLAPDVGLSEDTAHFYFRQVLDGVVRPQPLSDACASINGVAILSI